MFSQETEAVLTYLDEFCRGNLRKRNDIGLLLDIGWKHEAAQEVNEVVFAGKCVWNVYQTLKKQQPNTEGLPKLEQEMMANIAELREKLIFFVANADEQHANRFNEVYLGTHTGTVKNLIDLSFDLAVFKDVQNQKSKQ